MEICGELVDELTSESTVVDVIDLADGLFGMPGHTHFAFRVSGMQQPAALGVASVVETFMGSGEEPPRSVEGIGL